jgi:hypothetical protein
VAEPFQEAVEISHPLEPLQFLVPWVKGVVLKSTDGGENRKSLPNFAKGRTHLEIKRDRNGLLVINGIHKTFDMSRNYMHFLRVFTAYPNF